MNEKEFAKQLWRDLHLIFRNEGIASSLHMREMTYAFLIWTAAYGMGYPYLMTKLGELERLESQQPDGYSELFRFFVPGTDSDLAAVFADAQTRLSDPTQISRMAAVMNAAFDTIQRDKLDPGLVYAYMLDINEQEPDTWQGTFVPMALADLIVEVMAPQPGAFCFDPNCEGLGMLSALNRYQKRMWQPCSACYGIAKTPAMYTSALASMFLNAQDGKVEHGSFGLKALKSRGRFQCSADVLLTSALIYGKAERPGALEERRAAFMEKAFDSLKPNGRAAMIVSDTFLYQGGIIGAVRESMLRSLDLHTVVRLPERVLHGTNINASLLLLDNDGSTKQTAFYDMRTDIKLVGRGEIGAADREKFLAGYRDASCRGERWSLYSIKEIIGTYRSQLDLGLPKEPPADDMTVDPVASSETCIRLLEEAAGLMREAAAEIRALDREG